MARRTEEELPIIRATYDYALVLLPQIEKFPREHRYALGEPIAAR